MQTIAQLAYPDKVTWGLIQVDICVLRAFNNVILHNIASFVVVQCNSLFHSQQYGPMQVMATHATSCMRTSRIWKLFRITGGTQVDFPNEPMMRSFCVFVLIAWTSKWPVICDSMTHIWRHSNHADNLCEIFQEVLSIFENCVHEMSWVAWHYTATWRFTYSIILKHG